MTNDEQLLQQYAQERSESAFAELVTRHIDYVYSAALRVVNGDTHLAQDVTQTVFIDLARKAGNLPRGVVLAGWLHRHTWYTAATAVRTERRRQTREQTAMEMSALDDNTRPPWELVAPYLDEGLNQLNPADRDALVLRFLRRQDFRAVGEALGISEDAAQKRVDRALEKLHVFLKQRGATLTAAALGTVLATEAVTAAPAWLAGSVAGAALASAAANGGVTATLVKLMTMTKLKLGIISVIAVAGVAVPLAIQNQSQAKLREENQILRQQASQLAQAAAEDERLSNLLAQADGPRSLPQDQLRELLRLRGEVGLLRQQSNYLARLQEENRVPRPLAHAQAVAGNAKAHSPEEDARYACINNLRVIENAIQMCALEHKIGNHEAVTTEQVLPYLASLGLTNGLPPCPLGGTYTFGQVGDKPSCSVPGHALQ
jgi:RNA polymerase sigma factor (sigma-70 family)